MLLEARTPDILQSRTAIYQRMTKVKLEVLMDEQLPFVFECVNMLIDNSAPVFTFPYSLGMKADLRHNTGIYLQVTGTCHFGKRAYPDLRVFSPAGIIGGYLGKMHCLPG